MSALIDSGASRSFISDRLSCRPALHFVGAYSALELANGETIVSTGIAPRVLVCIGSIPCRLSLTAVPMMEGIQLILGKDWLDIMNPLVDWRSNTMYLRNGSRLEPIGGIDLDKGKHCTIVDKGLPGLQHCFGTLKAAESTPTDENWRSRLALLSSPQFWRYDSSAKEWVHDQDRHSGNSSLGTVDAPQGGVPQQTFSPEATPQPQESPTKRRHRTKKVAGKCVKQPVRTKLDFISMRQAARRANKTDQPMFLCVVRATQEPGPKGKRRRSRAGAAKGMTEGEKRKLSKETGPVVKEVSITDTIRSKVAEADAAIREQLQIGRAHV